MINIGTIYKITNPAGKVYIGLTRDLKARIRKYKSGLCKQQRHLYFSLAKYGWDNHSIKILYQGSITDLGLNELEIHFIRIYNSYRGGLNLTEGGGGIRGYRHTEEMKEKARQRKASEETRGKMSSSRQGVPKAEEHKRKIKEAKQGVKRGPQPKEWTEKIKATKVVNKSACKAIDQYSLDGIFIKRWSSQTEASQALNISKANISSCLTGRYKQAKGFIFLYAK